MDNHFEIDELFLTSVPVRKEIDLVKDRDNPTPEELITIIKGTDKMVMTSSEDHPAFQALRTTLGANGFIKIERGWWNGDLVTKPFTLNEWSFAKGNKFPCAVALGNSIASARAGGYTDLCL